MEQRTEAAGSLEGKVLEKTDGGVFDALGMALKSGLEELAPFVSVHKADKCLARHFFAVNCEEELNNAINVAYNISYTFHAMSNYFYRDCVALPGLGKFFLKRCKQERKDAIDLSDYLARRGGSVKLRRIQSPENDFEHADKGDAVYAMELTVSMEKLQFEKYFQLTKAAETVGDSDMADYLSKEFLHPQVEMLKRHGEYLSQLRRLTSGHGIWHWDKTLAGELGESKVAQLAGLLD